MVSSKQCKIWPGDLFMDGVRGSFYGQRPGVPAAEDRLSSGAFKLYLNIVAFTPWVALPGEYTPDVLRPLRPVLTPSPQ
ncbi:hypothetical protein TNCV_240281 [Trichonephila clavipes]|nr:hypothetical protein TNCV_240281 [Trichonephila clavipes]